MSSSDTCSLTDLGRQAITTHSADLSVAQRRLLIMIGGNFPLSEILKEGSAIFANAHQEIEFLINKKYLVRGGPQAQGPAQFRPPQSAQMSASDAKIMEEELVDLVGPVGSILCEEVWPKATDIKQAIHLICQNLDAQQAAEFTQKIQNRLG